MDAAPAPPTRPVSPVSDDAPAFGGASTEGVVVIDRPKSAYRGLHKIAFGVRAGQSRFSLSAQSLAEKGMPVDNWSDRALLVAPTFCVGGDGYFIKLEAPIMKTSSASAYGFGLYPLNFGYLFEQSGLFPYASAGVAASVLTLPGQGVSGAFAVARLATGLKARVASGLAVSAELGYSPFAAAALVDVHQEERTTRFGNRHRRRQHRSAVRNVRAAAWASFTAGASIAVTHRFSKGPRLDPVAT